MEPPLNGASFDLLVSNKRDLTTPAIPKLTSSLVSMFSSFHLRTAKTSNLTAKNRQPQVTEQRNKIRRAPLSHVQSKHGCFQAQTGTHPIHMQYEIKAPPLINWWKWSWFFRPINERHRKPPKLCGNVFCIYFCSTNGNQIQVSLITKGYNPALSDNSWTLVA